MPLIELTMPEGALTAEARTALLPELVGRMLHWERAPDNDFFRSITWVHVHELPAQDVTAAGQPVGEPVFRLNVTIPQGALSDRRKAGLVDDLTKAVLEHAGLADDPAAAMRVWVIIGEVPDGNWAAAGQIVRYGDLVEAAKGQREAVATTT
jgi:phenylpyruvate tautomerase PptA (4-oxalocrotonate tautomerase family)